MKCQGILWLIKLKWRKADVRITLVHVCQYSGQCNITVKNVTLIFQIIYQDYQYLSGLSVFIFSLTRVSKQISNKQSFTNTEILIES